LNGFIVLPFPEETAKTNPALEKILNRRLTQTNADKLIAGSRMRQALGLE
jgi:hypothetical protein